MKVCPILHVNIACCPRLRSFFSPPHQAHSEFCSALPNQQPNKAPTCYQVHSSTDSKMNKFLIRGIGFFNDAYDLFVMNVINVVLTEQYGKEVYTSSMKSTVPLQH
ncbi:unnamed protein product [Phytophthora lilii]|uniref:Unnamed protein product n=1 Tax=Phytophthora lilii TaxID=2077276 RepID=A0A9W6UAV0_9STRA|nr:unnamed protein product [Phytophthora lilii]